MLEKKASDASWTCFWDIISGMPNLSRLNPLNWFSRPQPASPARPARPRPAAPQSARPQPAVPQDRRTPAPPRGQAAPRCEIFKPEDTHVHQYSHDDDLKNLTPTQKEREAQANCGPSSAAIVLRSMGLEAPSLHELRVSVGAATGKQNLDAYAIDSDQLIGMVEKAAARQGHQVRGVAIDLPRDARQAWNVLRANSFPGQPTVLLTGNMASRGPGHYVVMESVRGNTLQVNDPQFEDGHGTQQSFEEFKAAFERRQRLGRPNRIITFMPDLAKAAQLPRR